MIYNRNWRVLLFAFLLSGVLAFGLCGCGGGSGGSAADNVDRSGPPRDNTPKVLVPAADGKDVSNSSNASIDYSHSSEGYIMASYSGSVGKVKIKIDDPKGTSYIYLLTPGDGYEAFPLSGGNGTYKIMILENVSGDSYAIILDKSIDVSLSDDFLPFLYPNQYVNFTPDSKAVAKGADLAKDTYSDLEVIENIYTYVIDNITYDDNKAATVQYGYVPDVDETLSSGKGICFDYASLMCTMLRSQGIPARLDVGYSGEAYHAWISAYAKEFGWVSGIIEFDGKSWKLMDPTFGANNNASSTEQYIGDGTNYTLKNSY